MELDSLFTHFSGVTAGITQNVDCSSLSLGRIFAFSSFTSPGRHLSSISRDVLGVFDKLFRSLVSYRRVRRRGGEMRRLTKEAMSDGSYPYLHLRQRPCVAPLSGDFEEPSQIMGNKKHRKKEVMIECS